MSASETPAAAPRGINPAAAIAAAFVLVVSLWVSWAEFGPFFELPERRVSFAHPLSKQLDDMMRSDADVLVVGDPDFVRRMRGRSELGGSVQFLELPQVDLYGIVAVFPAILRAKQTMLVMESIPAYWGGDVYMNVNIPKGPVQAAVDQVRETERTPVAPPPPPGRDYIVSPPTKPFNYAEAMKLVFDNYNGYWREVDDCLLFVTNDELLAAAPPEFQAAYKAKFADPAELHVNVGHVASLDYAPTLLSECKAARVARENAADG
jgi:hypothetical protein